MSAFLDQIRGLSPARLALLADELKARLDEAEGAAREPIAIVGVGCRFPGADGPAEFWKLLHEGRDEIREIPADRWPIDEYFDANPDTPGKMSTRFGAFLDRIDTFDPHFFGIAPREALVLDPQQRLLLEVSWEALEHAGISPASLMGSRTGVYVGICNTDYHQLLLTRGADAIDAYVAPGNAHSVVAGRLSYLLGLQGPSLAIDTSCSASLVAIHAACQSLRLGESSLALAGGVNIICAPETYIALSKGHMLAPDGRCKTFDAAGDGFSRGEGCGIVVLKRLSDARRDGDQILALIRGSAVNQDGRSGGLTVPNGPAQEAVIREALTAAGLEPTAIDYVEAHGTGTSLGDPIEVRALGHALGEGRAVSDPVLIGSVKTNFGHLESAAGVAGLIKVVLSLQNEEIPRHLNFRAPSPHIEWGSLPVSVVSERRSWPRGERPRRAGVSSFGFSGTNAHVILEEAPVGDVAPGMRDRPLHILALSARSDAAIRQLAGRYAKVFASDKEVGLADAAHTAGVGRSHFGERMAVVVADEAEACKALQDAVADQPRGSIRRGMSAPGAETDVVFVYTGQGVQYAGMSRELYETAPVFRDSLGRCAALLAPHLDRPLLEILFPASGEAGLLDETRYTQPALFAVEYALTELWRSWGVMPSAVIGHSVGEYVAACVAGVLSLEDGLRLIAQRGRLMQTLPAGGAMTAIFAPEAELTAAIAPYRASVSIAAVNGPAQTVISGAAADVAAVASDFITRGVRCQPLRVSHAFHSPLVDSILQTFEREAARVRFSPPQIPLASNLDGHVLPRGVVPNAEYWRRHMRESVRFGDGIKALHTAGYRIFLEVGPHPALLALAQQSLSGADSIFVTSLQRGKGDWREMLTSLADLYVRGIPVDWAGFDRPYRRRRLALPTYPFERERYWAPATPHAGARIGTEKATNAGGLFYCVEWEPIRSEVPERTDRHEWLILADESRLAQEFESTIAPLGDGVTVVAPADWRSAIISPSALSNTKWWPRPQTARDDCPPVDIVYLGGLDSGEGAGRAPELSALTALAFLQAVSRVSHARVWMVTRGAQDVDGPQDVIAADQASVWGLGRTFALEHPLLWGGLLDLDPREDVADGSTALIATIRTAGAEDQVAWRHGQRFTPRIMEAPPPPAATLSLSSDTSYLITGGLGGLGLSVAQRLVDRGARHLVLVGRTPLPPREEWKTHLSDPRVTAIRMLERGGATVHAEAMDVGDATAMAKMMSKFGGERPALGGIVHAAVAPTSAPLASMAPEMMSAMFRTKVESARLLSELSASQPVSFFVAFSTTTALFGSAQLAHYAASNAVLDAFACLRSSAGKQTLSVNWGSWDQLRNVDEAGRARIARGGLSPMPTIVGLDALEALLVAGGARATVADIDWPVLRAVYENRRAQPILSRVAPPRSPNTAVRGAGLRQAPRKPRIDFESLEPVARRSAIDRAVRAEVAAVLGLISPDQLDPARNLFESGMDSLMSVDLKSRLEREVLPSLPPTLTFNYPTVQALVGFLDDAVAQRHSLVVSARERALLDRVPDMSEDEVDAMLARMLTEERGA